MSKNANFTGQPFFSQLLSLIDRRIISSCVRKTKADRYYKKFKTYDHLVAMLYAIFLKCNNIRELTTSMQSCGKKLGHLGLAYSPKRSTFAEANANRNPKVFELIYYELLNQYRSGLPDSRMKKKLLSRLILIDSTTFQLFKEILKNAGRRGVNGKKKGGVKAHIALNAAEDVPGLVRITAAANHDTPFIQGLLLPKYSIAVFDKGYVDFSQYDLWTKQNVYWVTRLRAGTIVETISSNPVSDVVKAKGVISDQIVILGHTSHKNVTRIQARLVTYHDKVTNKTFSFITNNYKLAAFTICQIYKKRWQIELLFKRLKQNFPLKYFLGDNENAIRIQIWCVLIADLLIKIISSALKRRWSFSNLRSMIRIHLMTYSNLIQFLNAPEKALWDPSKTRNRGPTLFEK